MLRLDNRHYIRHQLFTGNLTPAQRYRRLVVGEGSTWEFLRYETLTTLLGGVPGALGLALRRRFYRSLFAEIGTGVVFGRNVVIRNPRKIRLGNRVMIDDNCVIDARGAGEEGLVIEDDVIINRGTMVLAKVGPVRIGAESDIGAASYIVSQGGVSVGKRVAMGGGCKIGGGLIEMGLRSPTDDPGGGNVKVTRGPVRVGDRVAFGSFVVVLDGVEIGDECILGAGVVVREDIPPRMLVAPRQGLLLLPRTEGGAAVDDPGGAATDEPGDAAARPETGTTSPAPAGGPDPRTVRAIFAAIDDINLQLPPQERLRPSMDTPLQENGGALDSLTLINLIVASEERLAEVFGEPITLTDRNLAGAEDNPLATVGALVRYVERVRGRE